MADVHSYIDTHRERFLGELIELLRIPSISADPAHKADVERAAQWLLAHLRALGLEAELWPTEGHPVVYGQWLGAPEGPTVLCYGHYDVQPPDPLDLWQSPPSSPQSETAGSTRAGPATTRDSFSPTSRPLKRTCAPRAGCP